MRRIPRATASMIDRIRVGGAAPGRHRLVSICGPGPAAVLRAVEVAPVAPVDEAAQQPCGDQEAGQLECGGDHRRSSTARVVPETASAGPRCRRTAVTMPTGSGLRTATSSGIDMPPGGAAGDLRRQRLDAISTPVSWFL